MHRILCLLFILFSCFPVTASDAVSFNRDVRALLADRCFECHGPDEEGRQAELRLDIADGDLGPFTDRDGIQIIHPGQPDSSELLNRITTDDPDLQMPPADANKRPLNAAEVDVLRQWIQQGGEYEDFWAFVPPADVPLPGIVDTEWNLPIDRFVRAALQSSGLAPQPLADKRTLIRRVTFDLTGLPPTREEIRWFLEDEDHGSFERVVDRLLTSSQHGEHMARYWLDLVRFADTNGIHHDHYREMTPYRDWVIRAFNENLPYDEFVTFQLAGDLYSAPSLDQKIASGFNRLHLVIDRGTALPEESYTRNVVDRVTAFGTAFMGMTLGCAVCHDHKYDPVTQRDFYQLFAFFNNIDTEPETPGRNVHPPFIRLPSPEQQQQLRQLEEQIASTMSKEIRSELEKQKVALEKMVPLTLVSRERSDIRPAYVLTRGVYDQPGEQVGRNTPSFLPPLRARSDQPGRLDLARWLFRDDHPLTSRVAVNRIWQQLFGVGLVKTSEDFGAQGEYPTHPELLDHLARRFMAEGWNVRQLIRSIVLSRTYQQASLALPDEFRRDAENRHLARGSRFRMDAEVIRDQILAVSGLMNVRMYGKSVKPPQPPDLWKNVSMVSSSTYAFQADDGDNIYRRSVYSFWKRAMPPPQMTIFDAPTRESCIARRERTNTPVQALVLMNEEQYFLAARHFAQQVLKATTDEGERIRLAFESITSQLPDELEKRVLLTGLKSLRETYADDQRSAHELTADLPDLTMEQRVDISAWTMLVNTLFNLDIVKTRS